MSRLHRLHTLDGGESVEDGAATVNAARMGVCSHMEPDDDGPSLLRSHAFWLGGFLSLCAWVVLAYWLCTALWAVYVQ